MRNVEWAGGEPTTVNGVLGAAISQDPWILYHGTSECYAQDIESSGFDAQRGILSRREIERIVAVYDELAWSGTSNRGFCNLKPFSLEGSYGDSNLKPVFLGETAQRALLFATSDFAGGETVRSARQAIADLEEYLTSEDLRASHAGQIRRELEADPFGRFSRARTGDTPWLTKSVAGLREIGDKCAAAINAASHGVIYAVRVREADLPLLEYSPGSGVRWQSRIPASQIVGKIRIPASYKYQPQFGLLPPAPAYSGALREWVDLVDETPGYRTRQTRRPPPFG